MNTSKLTAFAFTAALTLATAATAADTGNNEQGPALGDQNDTQKLTPNTGTCSMDYDNSGTIDFGDFLHVMTNWGDQGGSTPQMGSEPPTGDAGGYGFAELMEVINNFGRRCKRTVG